MFRAPTIQHCSLPVRRPQPFVPPPTPTAPVDGPHPRDLPENQYSYRPPPQHHPVSQASQPAIQPASQPASYPCPTYFPRYAPPYTILECRFLFWVHSIEPRRTLSLLISLIFLSYVSLPITLTLTIAGSLSRSAFSCHYPSCFSFLVSSSFSSSARVLRVRYPFLLSLFLSLSPSTRHKLFPLDWCADSANHPYWRNDLLKRTGAGKA